ncbi:tbc1 domain family member hypothetical protein [Limosa lapponica baueri]|uniref:Uncharacterized protein n=1 Tax=Limosa lapponica baueri TaxID=1758121 RepID=A0A2I0T5M5_LIMLA|nr:tbc1 domain family member hypothetical protein [Limosa lapponica baueri]
MERRKLTLQRKREEYFGFIQQYYDSRNEEHHQDTYRQDEGEEFDAERGEIEMRSGEEILWCEGEEDVENFDVTNLSQDVLRSIEADSFWCMSKLLDGIQNGLGWKGP